MATKVFYRCIETFTKAWIVGKEYECIGGEIITEFGNTCDSDDADDMCAYSPMNAAQFERIERDCFEANGHTWFRHTPGDPMPCDGDAAVIVLRRDGVELVERSAHYFRWELPHGMCSPEHDAIGWRFADAAKTSGPEPQTSGANLRTCDDETPDRFPDFAWLEFLKLAAPDVAAVEDTSLPPRIRRIVNEKEDAQAAKQQLAKDAQDKALQERADQLADAGKAMDRVNQDHGHRLGWMA